MTEPADQSAASGHAHVELEMLTAGERLARAADRLQQRNPRLAFPVAVGKKFSDDHAHNLAALIAYFAFVSIFPLLLVLATVLDITLRGDAALRHRLLASALGSFPVIGTELRGSAHPLRETGIALIIGLAGALLGGCGVAAAAQNALNSAWLVPFADRPRFPRNQLRNLAFVIVVGLRPPPLTPQDMTAYRLYARAEQRRQGIGIDIEDHDAVAPAGITGDRTSREMSGLACPNGNAPCNRGPELPA